jgi:hypothetical protein
MAKGHIIGILTSRSTGYSRAKTGHNVESSEEAGSDYCWCWDRSCHLHFSAGGSNLTI